MLETVEEWQAKWEAQRLEAERLEQERLEEERLAAEQQTDKSSRR